MGNLYSIVVTTSTIRFRKYGPSPSDTPTPGICHIGHRADGGQEGVRGGKEDKQGNGGKGARISKREGDLTTDH